MGSDAVNSEPPTPKPRALSLELTKGCNLRCGYCYYAAREEPYDPGTAMSPAVAERSIDLLLREADPDQTPHLHLFGGEPLLNFRLLRHVVEYGERRAAETGRGITFEVTTNGTCFTDAVIAFLNAHRVQVGVSFDGPPEVQDAARPALHGSSYARAVPGIRRFLASRAGTELAAKTHCSVVVTRRELDLAKIVRHLEELGFEKIILTPVTDANGESVGLREEDLPAVRRGYDTLAERYFERVRAGRAVSVTWFETLMARLLSGERKTAFCGAGRDYLGVAADGSVALCYRFYENEEFALGNVETGIDRSPAQALIEHPLEQRLACSTCWARYFCGGGCHHENLVTTGSLGEPNKVTCEILRHGMGRTLELWARLSAEGCLGERQPVAWQRRSMSGERYSLGDRPRTRPSCHVREVGPECVVYEPVSHEVAFLNETAAWIFGRCDGTRTVGELLDEMAASFEAPRDVLRQDLEATLELFRHKGFLA